MARYIALVDAADGIVGVSFPDAPGCVAQSENRDEAFKDATAALAEWVAEELAEGRDAPRPEAWMSLWPTERYDRPWPMAPF